MTSAVRTATTSDIGAMQEIERRAGEQFRGIGMPSIADDPPSSTTGRAWVIDDDDGAPVAYLLVETVDDAAHVAQVSVLPEPARRGLGRALVDHADEWARANDLSAISLTTFRDVPWNGPYYERLGFTTVPADEQGPQLRSVVESERHLERGNGPRIVQRPRWAARTALRRGALRGRRWRTSTRSPSAACCGRSPAPRRQGGGTARSRHGRTGRSPG